MGADISNCEDFFGDPDNAYILIPHANFHGFSRIQLRELD
jgi:hypothetical protein